MKQGKIEFRAFTIKHSRKVDRVITEIVVYEPFDPLITDIKTVKSFQTTALWDTGATRSSITKKVVEELNLPVIGMTKLQHAGGLQDTNTYLTNILLPQGVLIGNITATEVVSGSFGMLIGMDIITMGDLAISNNQNDTWLSFRMPSFSGTDYVIELEDHKYRGINKYDPCPCGSKDKFGKAKSYGNCHYPIRQKSKT